jgi:hypothetical protein
MNIIKQITDNTEKNKIIDIKLNNKTKKAFENFKVGETKNYDFFGKINDIDINTIKDFFMKHKNNSNQNCEIISNFFVNLGKRVCKGYKKNSCWMSIRLSVPNDQFKIPRWHLDGKFFQTTNNINSKFVYVPKGDGTLLLNVSNKDKVKYNEIKRPTSDDYKNNTPYIKKYRHEIWINKNISRK